MSQLEPNEKAKEPQSPNALDLLEGDSPSVENDKVGSPKPAAAANHNTGAGDLSPSHNQDTHDNKEDTHDNKDGNTQHETSVVTQPTVSTQVTEDTGKESPSPSVAKEDSDPRESPLPDATATNVAHDDETKGLDDQAENQEEDNEVKTTSEAGSGDDVDESPESRQPDAVQAEPLSPQSTPSKKNTPRRSCDECRQRRARGGSSPAKCGTCGRIVKGEASGDIPDIDVAQLEQGFDNQYWPDAKMCGTLLEQYHPLTDPHLKEYYFNKQRTRKTLQQTGILARNGRLLSDRQWIDSKRRAMRQEKDRQHMDEREQAERKWRRHQILAARQREKEEGERQAKIKERRAKLEEKRKERAQKRAEQERHEEEQRKKIRQQQAQRRKTSGTGKDKGPGKGKLKEKGDTRDSGSSMANPQRPVPLTQSSRYPSTKDMTVAALWQARTPARVVTRSKRKS